MGSLEAAILSASKIYQRSDSFSSYLARNLSGSRELDLFLLTYIYLFFKLDVGGPASRPLGKLILRVSPNRVISVYEKLSMLQGDYKKALEIRIVYLWRVLFFYRLIPWRFSHVSAKVIPVLIELSMLAGSDDQASLNRRLENSLKLILQRYIRLRRLKALRLPGNRSYQNLIKRRHLHLVGPCEDSHAGSQLTHSYDHLICFNDPVYYSKSGCGFSDQDYSSSYFNGQKAELFLLGDQALPKSIRFVIMKSDSQLNRIRPRHGLDSRRYEFMFNPLGAIYNLAPLIVLDLLVFEPASIMLSGVNLYVGKPLPTNYLIQSSLSRERLKVDRAYKRIAGEERKSIESKPSVSMDFLHHNPFSQYALLRYLHVHGFINVSPMLEAVLKMSSHEYARSLEARYASSSPLLTT